MSDEIYCAADGCEVLAEIEVERGDDTLWLCGKHHGQFFGSEQHHIVRKNTLIVELERQLGEAKTGQNAWYQMFGTSQLSHAIAERDQLRAEVERLRGWAEYLEGILTVERVEREINESRSCADPALLAQYFRDLDSTQNAGLNDLVWELTNPNSTPHINDIRGVIEKLRTYLSSLHRLTQSQRGEDEPEDDDFYCEECHNTGHPFVDCQNELSGHDYRYTCGCKIGQALDEKLKGKDDGKK